MHEFYNVYAEVYVGESKVYSGYYKDVITNAIPKDLFEHYYLSDGDAPSRFNYKIGNMLDLYWNEKNNILQAYGYKKLADIKEASLTVHYVYKIKCDVSIQDVLNHRDVINAMAYLIERYEEIKESFNKRRE